MMPDPGVKRCASSRSMIGFDERSRQRHTSTTSVVSVIESNHGNKHRSSKATPRTSERENTRMFVRFEPRSNSDAALAMKIDP